MNKKMYLNATIVITILSLCGLTYFVKHINVKPECLTSCNNVIISDQDWFKAIKEQDLETVKANVDIKYGIKNKNGLTGLMVAAKNGLRKVAQLLLYKESRILTIDGISALMYAIEADHISIAEMLIDKEAGIVSYDDGSTALMYAAKHGCTEIASMLIDKEAGRFDCYGKTALMYAAKHGRTEIASMLIDKEAGRFDRYGKTALMYAAKNGHIEIVKLLAEKERGMKDKQGLTAFLEAINGGYVRVARFLMKYTEESAGCDCNELINYLLNAKEHSGFILIKSCDNGKCDISHHYHNYHDEEEEMLYNTWL